MKIPCMVIIDGLDTFAVFRCSEFAFFTTDFNANLSEVHQLLSTLILVLKVVFAGFDSFSPSIFSSNLRTATIISREVGWIHCSAVFFSFFIYAVVRSLLFFSRSYISLLVTYTLLHPSVRLGAHCCVRRQLWFVFPEHSSFVLLNT